MKVHVIEKDGMTALVNHRMKRRQKTTEKVKRKHKKRQVNPTTTSYTP